MSEIIEIVEKIKNETDIFSKARYISHLLNEKKVKVVDLSQFLGIKPSYICHINRLNKLPDIIIDAYYSKLVSVSHLFLLSRIKDFKKMVEIYEQILQKGLGVKETEDLMREYLYGIKNKGNYLKKKDKQIIIESLKNKITDAEISLVQTRTKSKLIIEVKGNLENTNRAIKSLVEIILKK